MRGSEILPSDRTGIDRERSGSFHTLIARTSSLPITKLSSCGLLADATIGCAREAIAVGAGSSAPGCAAGTCAQAYPARKMQTSPQPRRLFQRSIASIFTTNLLADRSLPPIPLIGACHHRDPLPLPLNPLLPDDIEESEGLIWYCSILYSNVR